jgi:hypothetical protein
MGRAEPGETANGIVSLSDGPGQGEEEGGEVQTTPSKPGLLDCHRYTAG